MRRCGSSLASRFLSTPSARRATLRRHAAAARPSDFYPRPPRGGRRPGAAPTTNAIPISIHALREEGDAATISEITPTTDFYPRPPRGGRHWSKAGLTPTIYFYPRPPRGGRRANRNDGRRGAYFYPRPPRGGRLFHRAKFSPRWQFLSTPSARRATSTHRFTPVRQTISIHALREEGDSCDVVDAGPQLISIHALREEGDTRPEQTLPARTDFYPRPPRGGRPAQQAVRGIPEHISIHALREEGDSCDVVDAGPQLISIHALREEGDTRPEQTLPARTDFYPRPPRGGRPAQQAVRGIPEHISIHALREEGDTRRAYCLMAEPISIHALREEGDDGVRRRRCM